MFARARQPDGRLGDPACRVLWRRRIKPTYDRIPTAGIVYYSKSVDHVGLFTQDVAGMAIAASVVCNNWQPIEASSRPVLGVPEGAYLAQASEEGLAAFEAHLGMLERAGYPVRRIPALPDIAEIAERHNAMASADAAEFHSGWFAEQESLYRPVTRETILRGQAVTQEQLAAGRESRGKVRAELQALMDAEGIDCWVCPPALGTAPEGIALTGNPAMNLPWTHTGMPTVTVPAGKGMNGLPLGFQIIARADQDEHLLAWAGPIAEALATHG